MEDIVFAPVSSSSISESFKVAVVFKLCRGEDGYVSESYDGKQ